ncbi:MAG TPA: hypothetical protein VK158_02895 [Acidobacteriota bacterium]|nr:hypothetical protein [Acidobacteriota bacterium]
MTEKPGILATCKDIVGVAQLSSKDIACVGKDVVIVNTIPSKHQFTTYVAAGKIVLFCVDANSADTVVRAAIEQKVVHGIFGIEYAAKRDSLHTFQIPFESVIAKLCQKNGVIVCFSFAELLAQPEMKRIAAMTRLMHIAKLCRKYGVVFRCFTFARQATDLRNPVDLQSLVTLLSSQKQLVNILDPQVKALLDEKKVSP